MHRPLSRKHIRAARQNLVFEWIKLVSLRDEFQTFHSANQTFPSQNLPVMSLRGGRIFAPDAAILKFPFRNPRTRYGDTSRHPPILIRRGATPPRRFPGSAISRGRKSAFHMRSIFHLLEKQISLRSLDRASFRDAMPLAQRLPRPPCGLAMTRKMVGFSQNLPFFNQNIEIRPGGTPTQRPLGALYHTAGRPYIICKAYITQRSCISLRSTARPAHCGNRTVTVVPTPGVLSSRMLPR